MTPLSRPLVFDSRSELSTERFAAGLAPLLETGDVVALSGPLGSGKTRLVRALAAALHCDTDFVNSPTFSLVQQYEGSLPVVHIDAYRLASADEFERLGGAELFDPHGVTLIEWADRIVSSLPRERWTIVAEHLGEGARRYRIDVCQADGNDRLARLAASLPAG